MKKLTGASLVAAGVLFVFPPERYRFYPRCPVYETFGLLCPGCGATRAAAALLHGHVLDALRWNALFVMAIVAGLLCAGVRWRKGSWPEPQTWQIVSMTVITLLFGMARNVV